MKESLGVYRLRFNGTLRFLFESASFKSWFTLLGSTLWDSAFSGFRFWIWGAKLWGPHSGVYALRIYSLGLPILDLDTHLHTLGVYTLGAYSLGQPILDLDTHLRTLGANTLGANSLGQPILDLVKHLPVLWETTLWGPTLWSHRFWIWSSTYLSSGGQHSGGQLSRAADFESGHALTCPLGANTLGANSLEPPILHLDMHLPVLKAL